MHRHNSDYYAYWPSTTSSRTPRDPSAQNAHYQYYDHRRRPAPNLYEYPYYSSTPRQYQSESIPSNLSEPLSIFDEIRSMNTRRTPLPSIYVPPSPGRRPSANNMRLEHASAFRAQLLTDIQETIGEIDRELRSLGPTPTPFISQSVPPRQSSSFGLKKEQNSSLSQLWPSKPKRAYQVVPRLQNESNRVSRESTRPLIEEPPARHSTPKTRDLFTSQSFFGQYHYGPEADEIEIVGNVPENIERTSMIVDMQDLSFFALSSTQQFLREPSMLSQHRAMHFVPEYGDSRDVGTNEWTEDLLGKEPSDLRTLRPSTVRLPDDFPSTGKVNIRDFQPLIQTAPEKPIPPPPPPPVEKVESPLVNSIISKAVKHARLPVSQATMAGPDKEEETGYFFSDFGKDGVMDDEQIVIDPSNFALPDEPDTLRQKQPSRTLL